MPVAYGPIVLDGTTTGQLDMRAFEWNRDFSYEIRIYTAAGVKVAEIVGDMQNTALESLDFELLRNGGCGAFSFTLAEEFTAATIDYNYKVEICFYTQPNPWFTGFIMEVPKKGTDTKWRYAGYGYFKQLDFIRVSLDDTTLEDVAVKATSILDTYVTPETDIVKDTDKIETVSYTTTGNYKWDRITARTCFERLAELATDYEFGVDEELDFYFKGIDTTVLDRFWIGKHLTEFLPLEDQTNLCNKLYIRCGRLTDGTDYVLYVENGASQGTYGLREDVVRAPEFFPLWSTTNLVPGKTISANPAGTNKDNVKDEDYSTYWESDTAQASGHYIQVDLGATFDQVGKVVLDSIHTDCQEYYARGFTVKTSLDAAAWTTRVTVSENSAWKPSVTFTPVAARHVRVELNTADTNEWKLGEFEVYELDTADIERWGNYILDDRKDIRVKATAVIEGIDKRINRKGTIAPIKPVGKIGVYEEDGTHINDYAVMACRYFLSSGRFDVRLELGELEYDSGSELLKVIRQLKEYDAAGIRNTGDLSGGIGYQEAMITETMIAKDAIHTPHLMANSVTANEIAALSITTEKLAADAVIAAKINVVGLDGASGRIAILDATDADEITAGINTHATTLITPGKIVISGVVNLDDWRAAGDLTHVDGAEVSGNTIGTAQIDADAVTAAEVNVAGLDGASGRIAVLDDTDADEITAGINTHATTLLLPGKIVISGATNLEDWRKGGDLTMIDGGSISANTVTATEISVAQLDAISIDCGTLTAGTITSGLTVDSLWRLVDTWTCASETTSHTFAGLTGDTAIEYMIKCRWVRYRDGAADPMNYIMCCNDDTAANYGFSTNYTVDGISGGAENAAYDGIWIGRADANGELSQGQGILHAISGFDRTFSGQFSACVNNKDVERIYNCECVWDNTANEITSLVFYATTADGIGVGSQIDIYERIG